MSVETALVIFALGALIGAGVCYVAYGRLLRARVAAAEARTSLVGAELAGAQSAREEFAIQLARASVSADRVPHLEQTIADISAKLEAANTRVAEAQAGLEIETKTHAVRIEELEKVGNELENKFLVLANSALGKNSESFLNIITERFAKHDAAASQDLEGRHKAIEALVKPIAESLSRFELQVGQLEKAREGAFGAINEQVRILAEGQVGLRTETSRLVQALRQPKTRGRWGEYQLRNVLEMSGMMENVDFIEQKTLHTDEGILRPDVVIRLPGGKSIVVDAKTPLDAYLTAVEATDETTRERQLAEHARQVRDHIRILGTKEYWNALPVTPDFVVMFVPGEAFFAAAIESDPNLFEQAIRQRVLLSTPTTFIALVKAIAYGWQQEKLAANAQAIAGIGRDLFERIRVFGSHMGGLGRALRGAVDGYNKAVGSLEGRVLPAVRKFETLGIGAAGRSISRLEPVDLEARDLQSVDLLQLPSEPQGVGDVEAVPPDAPTNGLADAGPSSAS